MLRERILATLVSIMQAAAAGVQAPSVLHIKIVLLDAERKAVPVPHHALLISDNPSSAPPRRIVTGPDGTANPRLLPGNYTVESDQPVVFQGKAYQWTKDVDIVAGRDGVLELTADNAEVEDVTSASTTSAPMSDADPSSSLLMHWQDSVVAIWTPTTRASGFVIDAKGLIATNQRLIGTATSVDVQLTPAVKVAGRVVVADAARDVAVIWIDPAALGSARPVPLGCALAKPPVVEGQEIFTIGTPLRGEKSVTSGTVRRLEPHAILSDVMLVTGSAGGPVFIADGGVVGVTSVEAEKSESRRRSARVVRIGDACEAVAAAEKKMKDGAPPDGAPLPVEPARPFPPNALEDAAKHRAGSVSPYPMSSSNFDVVFITPVLNYAAQYQSEQASRRERGGSQRTPSAGQALVRPLMEFSNWSEYVADVPPVLLVRATPKLVEGFWTKVARGAAQTQGVSIPPIKRFTSGFARMRAFCGDVEVTPIHPFRLEQRISETEAIYEGLYVFDPGALGPQCGTVKLVLYSEKEPTKGDTRVVDPKVLAQIWQDFAPFRVLSGPPSIKTSLSNAPVTRRSALSVPRSRRAAPRASTPSRGQGTRTPPAV